MLAARPLPHRQILVASASGNRLIFMDNKQFALRAPNFETRHSFSQVADEWWILQDETALLLSTQSDTKIANEIIIDVMTRWQSHPKPQLAAKESHDLLFHWLESHRDNNNITSAEPFLLTIKAWNRVGDAQQAADVLELWARLLEGDLELAPTLEAHHVLLECFAKQGIAEESLGMLEYLERMQSIAPTLEPPNAETFAHIITCLTRTNDKHNERWGQILSIMEKLDKVSQHGPRSGYFRLLASSQVICYAVAIDRRDDAVFLLQKSMTKQSFVNRFLMIDFYWREFIQQDSSKASPAHLVSIAYQSVLSKLSKDKAPQQMNTLITRLQELLPDTTLPWPQHYTMTVDAWSNTCTNDKNDEIIQATASRCEELLKQMEQRHLRKESDKMISFEPYERVLWMYGRTRQPAEHFLAHVMNLLEKHPDKFLVSDEMLTAAWNHVLKAFHLSNQPNEVLRLWQRMDDRNVKSNSTTMEVVLKTLSRTRHPDDPILAEQVLRDMDECERNTAHYEAVVVTWSRSSKMGAGASAQALLEELEQLYDNADEGRRRDLRPTVSIYNAAITAHGRRKNEGPAHHILDRMMERAQNDPDCPLPNSDTFGAFLDGLSRQRSKTAAAKAEEMLAFMESTDFAKPHKGSYTTVMTAIIRSGDWQAPERVMRIYNRMLESCENETDAVTYGMLLDMWAKSRRQNAGEMAEQILHQMKSSGLNPNVVNYNNAILAHARSNKAGSFARAEALLREMQEFSVAGDKSINPNTVSYTNVIQALKRSAVENKAQAARTLFQEMLNETANGNTNVRPNVITVNSVLTACAFTKGDDEIRKRAIQIALSVFSEMEQHAIVPNSNSFRTLLEAFGRQVSDKTERTKMAEIAFRRCQREGLVDSTVVKALRKFLPELYDKLSTSVDTTHSGSGHVSDDRSQIDRAR